MYYSQVDEPEPRAALGRKPQLQANMGRKRTPDDSSHAPHQFPVPCSKQQQSCPSPPPVATTAAIPETEPKRDSSSEATPNGMARRCIVSFVLGLFNLYRMISITERCWPEGCDKYDLFPLLTITQMVFVAMALNIPKYNVLLSLVDPPLAVTTTTAAAANARTTGTKKRSRRTAFVLLMNTYNFVSYVALLIMVAVVWHSSLVFRKNLAAVTGLSIATICSFYQCFFLVAIAPPGTFGWLLKLVPLGRADLWNKNVYEEDTNRDVEKGSDNKTNKED